jgi:hypothetical protein
MRLSRRRFLTSLAGGAAGIALLPPAAALGGTRADTLRVALVLPPGARAADGAPARAERGARLGAEEAAHAAALFGRAVELTVRDDASLAVDAHVLLGGFDDAESERLSDLAERGAAVFLNVGASGDALRTTGCRRRAFHVTASEAMLRAARTIAGDRPAVASLWHDSLEKYGAAQLNDRYRARFASGMTGEAWAAWMAVKVAAEAALRTRSTRADDLAGYLARPTVRFDGHKGRPLSFGAADHQLRQPLYLVRADGSADEVDASGAYDASSPACGAPR